MATVQANKTFTDGLAFDANPVNTNFVSLRNFANNELMHLDGTVSFSGNLNMGANKVTNLAAPSAGGDLATKTYADSIVVMPKNTWTQAEEGMYFTGTAGGVSYYSPRFQSLVAVDTDLGSDVTITPAGTTFSDSETTLTFSATGRYGVEITVDSSTNALFSIPSYFGVGSSLSVTQGTGMSSPTSLGVNTYPGFSNIGYIRNGGTTSYGAEIIGVLDVYAPTYEFRFEPQTSSGSSELYTATIKVYKIGDI